MRILVVVHNYPPRHQAGAENYSAALARALVARGHDVTVFTTDQSVFRRNYSRRTYTFDGIRVIEVTNHRKYATFEHSYADANMVTQFNRVVADVLPDIVHFQHLLHHSVANAVVLRDLEVPSVMTLHEYWTMCARNGQLIREDETRCDLPVLDTCAQCMTSFMWGRKSLDVWALRGVQTIKAMTGVDFKAKARQVRIASKHKGDVPESAILQMKSDLLVREARMRDLFDSVDCFVAPSRFLRERFIAWGLDGERIVVNDYGTDLDGFVPIEPDPDGDRLRIGFLGSVQPVKGLHVLLRAVDEIDPARYELRVWGDVSSKPEYVEALQQDTRESVRLLGKIHRERIPSALETIDVLVVPSVWWENSPLVIHEAFAARIPVICSGIGGMAELVEHDVSGLHFTPGSHNELRDHLAWLIDHPEELVRLKRGIPAVKPIAEDAEFHEILFETVIASREDALEHHDFEDELWGD